MAKPVKTRSVRGRQAVPAWIAPQLATLTAAAPDGDDWVHEIKYDGYRLLARVEGESVRLLTRNRKDWTERFPTVASALAQLALRGALLDGEVAVETEGGTTSFQALQNVLSGPGHGSLQFFVFDALYLGGEDVQRLPLIERKGRLEKALRRASRPLRYSDHVVGRGPAFFQRACDAGLEGIISKRARAPYRPGRGTDWLKVKCVREQEFVIGGFTEPAGSRAGLGALHVGAYDGDRLVYRGKVGTGFSARFLLELRRRLNPLRRADSPFSDGPRGAGAKSTHWVEPRLVAQIRFTDITADGRLRHPSFEGLREDRDAREVTLEPFADAPAPRESAPTRARSRANVPAPRESAPTRGRARGGAPAMVVAGVRLSSPSKVLYPEQGLTKLDLAEYYVAIADRMLPHLRGRPLTLVRCPSGRDRGCFFQKHVDESAPAELERVLVEESDGPEWYGVANDVPGLVALAQLGALELHTLNARADRLDRPDRFILDLDPDVATDWDAVVEAALHIRSILEELELRAFLKTTGGKGVHVVVPLTRRSGWDEVKAFSRGVAARLAQAAPDRYTLESSKKKRRGRILLDYLRNAYGSTAVEVYSTRARAGAPVATPIEWTELKAGVRADSFNVQNLPARLARLKRDPWADFLTVRQSLTARSKRRLGL